MNTTKERAMSVNKMIASIEERFKIVGGLDDDLSKFPLPSDKHLQVATNKAKSDTFGEVFTPLALVDKMLLLVDLTILRRNTLDLCAGYGQFSVRLLRALYVVHGERLDLRKTLSNHWLSELQISSAYKLLYIFGNNVNIAIGDSKMLPSLKDEAKGVWMHNGTEWVNITDKTRKFVNRHINKTYDEYLKVITKRIAE